MHLVNGKTKRVTASEAIQFAYSAQAKSIDADKAVQGVNGCGELLGLLTGLIEG